MLAPGASQRTAARKLALEMELAPQQQMGLPKASQDRPQSAFVPAQKGESLGPPNFASVATWTRAPMGFCHILRAPAVTPRRLQHLAVSAQDNRLSAVRNFSLLQGSNQRT